LGVGTGEPLNEVPLGYEYPGYKERSERMKEALEIFRALFSGEKLNYTGTFYKTENVKLYSPPLHTIPVYLAAGGPKSADLAAQYADGVIVSVKDVQQYKNEILAPLYEKVKDPTIVASRWTVFASNPDEAWNALQSWRGLRAPNRNTISDPEELQKEADSLPREEVISKYSLASSPEDYLKVYAPLISELHAKYVVLQTTTAGKQEDLIQMLGKEVVPELKKL
jgi:coenzyme F420-dependent glucose-6-phosphate dehydrogenase